MSNARGNTIAGAVGGTYLLVAGDTFTKTVFAPTNADVSVNSDSVRKRVSDDGSARNFVLIAELDTAINDLKETWRYLVKLHNLPWNAINRLGEDQVQRPRHYALVALEVRSREPSNRVNSKNVA